MKEGYTRKLYWGKWTHKVTLLLGRVDEGKVTTETKYKKVRSKLKAFLKDNVDAVKTLETEAYVSSRRAPTPDDRYYYPNYIYVRDKYITVYFKDANLLSKLQDDPKIGKMITYVEKPFNDSHLEALEVERMVVRKTLWYDKYRYAARMKPYQRTYGPSHTLNPGLPEDIEDWLDDQLIKSCGRREGRDFKIQKSGYYVSTLHYYFAHAQDAMMFRLAWGQYIKQNERIKLMSELDSTTEETQDVSE